MNLVTNLHFFFLALLTESFHLRDVGVTNNLHGRAMPTRKCDQFSLSSQREDQLSQDKNSKMTNTSSKRIIFIRHGKTYMNELIGGGGITFGQPDFTDIFQDAEDQKKYQDSPLSEVGIQQARSLNSKLRDLKEKKPGASDALGPSDSSRSTDFLDDLDLVVVSPLTRALQTLELSLYEHIVDSDVPILAVASAAERLYLVSDLGKPRSELRPNYPFVDFDSAFSSDNGSKSSSECSSNEEDHLDVWHFSPTKQLKDEYVEWRPHGQGQLYACLGEPSEQFDRRMSNFYYWLESREENCIAIVCHAGVIEWMTSGQQYANCELRVQTFNDLRPRALQERIPESIPRTS